MSDNYALPENQWRTILPIHPAAELLPRMSPKALKALGEDIKVNGLQTPVVVHAGKLLDGISRLDGMTTVGLDVIKSGALNSDLVKLQEVGGADFDPVAFVFSANVHRRHLAPKDRRALAGKLLEQSPDRSDRQIAALVGISHHTVEVVRRELEARGQLAHVETRTDSKGRKQPARKKPSPPPPPAPDLPDTSEPKELGTLAAEAFNKLEAKDLDDFAARVSARHHRALKMLFAERADNVAEIGRLARDIRGFLAHPEQHVDEIKKRLSRIVALVDADGKAGTAKEKKSNAKLDSELLPAALGLKTQGSTAAIRAVEKSLAGATSLRPQLESQLERMKTPTVA